MCVSFGLVDETVRSSDVTCCVLWMISVREREERRHYYYCFFGGDGLYEEGFFVSV